LDTLKDKVKAEKAVAASAEHTLQHREKEVAKLKQAHEKQLKKEQGRIKSLEEQRVRTTT